MHEHVLDSSPRAFYWLAPSYDVVFLLTSKGRALRSNNEGASWTDQTKQLSMAPFATAPLPSSTLRRDSSPSATSSASSPLSKAADLELEDLQRVHTSKPDIIAQSPRHYWGENLAHADLLSTTSLEQDRVLIATKQEPSTSAEQRAYTPQIAAIYHDADPNRIYLMELGVTYMWRSPDQGATYERVRLPFYVTSLLPHPVNPNWILATGLVSSNATHVDGFLSVDGGFSWSAPLTYVWRLTWGSYDEQHASDFFVLRQSEPVGQQYSSKPRDVLKCTLEHGEIQKCRLLLSRVNSMFYYHNILFVSMLLSETVREPLYFSIDEGATMKPVLLPEDYVGRYTVLSSGDVDSVWINVLPIASDSAQPIWGDTFVSALEDEVFSLALRYTRRAPSSGVDMQPVYSLPGAYVANQVTNADAVAHTQGTTDHVRTLFSYDNGGEWNPLPLPHGASCPHDSTTCSLHLFGPSETQSGYAYSKQSAVGIVMATGNVGEYLEVDPRGDEVDTYLTRDAGHTWIKIAQGAHTYEIADHGGLLVLVDNNNPTSEFLYSWDEGASWSSCHFTGQGDMDVRNVIALPSGKSQTFLLYGTRRIQNTVYQVVVQLDLSTLHERQCVGADRPGEAESDYELWTPTDFEGNTCILGQEINFIRRRPLAACFNGQDLEREHVIESCLCSREDYECDYCFELDASGETCVPEKSGVCANVDPLEPPVPCSGHYLQSSGYRLVVDSHCDPLHGGLDLRPVEVACPQVSLDDDNGSGVVIGVLVTLALLILAVCGGLFYLRKNPDARAKVSQALGDINLDFLAPADEDSQRYSRLEVSDALLNELSDEEEADLIEDLPLESTLASDQESDAEEDGHDDDIILLDN
eukprot:CAMPEP_0174239336 /NCGR_PEP_ID=MMETSP0417-20130205/14235_1 /TAXON_ID=242541 /ORGANISM="Mayorella sp, Strain BSH-02190019" /LENGTH=865 /DNA_ID=CAMNT_0015318273 /DNA_START=174 /DNA_END=2771 /DNA_ORIENTATION=-